MHGDQLATGPALDAAACQALHAALTAAGKPELARKWEPRSRHAWNCRKCGYWTSRFRHQECGTQEPFGHEQIMPAISSDGNVMLRALEHMQVLGCWTRLQSPFRNGEPWHCGFTPLDCTGWNGRPDWEESGDTAPEAVARAVVAALGGGNG